MLIIEWHSRERLAYEEKRAAAESARAEAERARAEREAQLKLSIQVRRHFHSIDSVCTFD
jgi:uncharacterized membrane protein YqiK